MRVVKEKSPLKERAAETLKSAPQAAFRRGADTAFQQLRQELRETAQDGQTEDRYESGKITDTADHAVRQVSRLAEKAVHKLPKTRFTPQQEGRTESNPQHECPKPQQPAAAPRESPPVSAQPSYPPQANRPVREPTSPFREKPVPPTIGKQPKMREYTPDAKTPVSSSQQSASWIHKNARAVATETMSLATERAVHEPAASIKEKLYAPANVPQPRMREHTPNAKASASQSRYPVPQTHENARAVSAETTSLATEYAVHEPAAPIKEKLHSSANAPQPKMREHTPTADAPVQQPQHPASQIQEKTVRVKEKSPPASAFTQTPAMRESTRPYVESAAPQRSVQQRGTPLRQETNGELSAWDEKQNVPHRTEHPKDHPQRVPVREQAVPQKTDTTHSALPAIKTKEYIQKKRKKQNLFKEETSSIGNAVADSETFSPVIRTRETVREQQKLHVSHTPEPAQTATPQIRIRQPQSSPAPVEAEPAMPEIPQPQIPDIKSKRKYIASQQPTQVTPAQTNPQQVAWQTGKKVARGELKLCQPSLANETASAPTSRHISPTKPVRVQKQARPAFVRKQKIKTAPKTKIKSATPATKALPSKALATAPKQAATVIRKGQALRDTAIKTAKVAKEAGKKVLRAIVAAAEKLVAAIGAGGAAAVSVVVVILLVGMLFASPLGILFAGEDTGTQIRIPDAVATLNGEFTDAIYRMMEEHPCDELDVQNGMETAMLQNWRNVLAVYAVKVSTDADAGMEVMTMDEEKLQLLREIFFDANKLDYELTTRTVDGERITTLHISAQIKDAMQMADEYGFTAQQREMLEELLKPDYDDIFLSLIGAYQPDGTPIGPVDISDIQGTLPDDLDPMRETVVLTAYQLLGKVTYFWGGKSLVIGWDSRWGTPTTVTAPGSGSTGKVLPFGLDCSGFVDWTFYNATGGSYLPGRGGGAASQHGYCTNIAWADALPGDLVFYADDSHVGIVCGYDSVGNLLVIHCSGGQNGVVVTGREGFAVAARPDLFTD